MKLPSVQIPRSGMFGLYSAVSRGYECFSSRHSGRNSSGKAGKALIVLTQTDLLCLPFLLASEHHWATQLAGVFASLSNHMGPGG